MYIVKHQTISVKQCTVPKQDFCCYVSGSLYPSPDAGVFVPLCKPKTAWIVFGYSQQHGEQKWKVSWLMMVFMVDDG